MKPGAVIFIAVVAFVSGLLVAGDGGSGGINVSENERLARRVDDLTEQLKNCGQPARQELAKCQSDLEVAKSAKPGRFVMRNEGSRTWRFDTALGRTCLLLAPEADWKNPQTQSQHCPD
jgi:hypothetical protein